jgi:hypothetical protein
MYFLILKLRKYWRASIIEFDRLEQLREMKMVDA